MKFLHFSKLRSGVSVYSTWIWSPIIVYNTKTLVSQVCILVLYERRGKKLNSPQRDYWSNYSYSAHLYCNVVVFGQVWARLLHILLALPSLVTASGFIYRLQHFLKLGFTDVPYSCLRVAAVFLTMLSVWLHHSRESVFTHWAQCPVKGRL